MAGYWSRTRPISSHLDRTNLVKRFIIWLSGIFFLRDTAGSPERARWLHLTRSCSQSHRAIWFILPAYEASHIINVHYCYAIKNIGHHARLKEHEHLFYYRAQLEKNFFRCVRELASLTALMTPKSTFESCQKLLTKTKSWGIISRPVWCFFFHHIENNVRQIEN